MPRAKRQNTGKAASPRADTADDADGPHKGKNPTNTDNVEAGESNSSGLSKRDVMIFLSYLQQTCYTSGRPERIFAI